MLTRQSSHCILVRKPIAKHPLEQKTDLLNADKLKKKVCGIVPALDQLLPSLVGDRVGVEKSIRKDSEPLQGE